MPYRNQPAKGAKPMLKEKSVYALVKSIPKPPDTRSAGAQKYPTADMEVGDSFVVPYGEMTTGEDGVKFRKRINQSVRNYAMRDFNTRREEDGAAKKKEFTVAIMPKDDDSDEKRWVTGDCVVWRDA